MTEIQVTEEYMERMAARTTRKTKAQLIRGSGCGYFRWVDLGEVSEYVAQLD